MILQYGNYRHENQEASFSISQRVIYSDQRIGIGHVARFVITGKLFGTDPADITAKIIALETAYGTNGRDFTVFLPDGVTPSAHSIVSAEAVDGTRVIDVAFPIEQGGEYTTYRSYRIILEADVLFGINNGTSNLIQSQFSLQYIGTGGPRRIWREPRQGQPIRQQVSDNTTIRAIQAGSSVGQTGFEPFPQPFFPSSEHFERRVFSQVVQNSNRFLTNYRFEFEGLPSDFPGF